MPLSMLNSITPYVKLFDISDKPGLDHLRVFGFSCEMSTPKQHRTIFEAGVEQIFYWLSS